MNRNATYYRELGGALAVYVILLVVAVKVGSVLAPGALRTGLALSPMLGVLLAIWAIVRQQGRSDEYLRKRTLEYIAIAAAVTAGWTLTYGFLEGLGYPRLSMFTVWPVMGGVWGLLSIVGAWRDR